MCATSSFITDILENLPQLLLAFTSPLLVGALKKNSLMSPCSADQLLVSAPLLGVFSSSVSHLLCPSTQCLEVDPDQWKVEFAKLQLISKAAQAGFSGIHVLLVSQEALFPQQGQKCPLPGHSPPLVPAPISE